MDPLGKGVGLGHIEPFLEYNCAFRTDGQRELGIDTPNTTKARFYPTWTLKDCRIMASWALFTDLVPLFYILYGSR